MILIDIYDMAGWWTLVIALQVAIISSYFLFIKKRSSKRFKDPMPTLDWNPSPLVEHDVILEEPPIVGKIDENTINVGATSFLSLHKEQDITEQTIKSMKKYGVGSCGPRGFYGTIDVHLELEERLAKFLEVEETCVYSYGFSTIASAIPSYAKKGDIVFADEKVWFAIQKGLYATRSTIQYFKHNNPEHLEELLNTAAKAKKLNPKRRAFLILEAIYFNTGEMCPLKRMVELARKYKLRIILDESLTIGVLGKHGRGITEHLNIPRDEIDLIVGSLEHSFATVGGFCAGTHFMVEHQRLSGLGYCFSASLPPMLTQAAITGLDILEAKPSILEELSTISQKMHTSLESLKHFTIRGDPISPIKHVYIKNNDLTDRLKHTYLRNIANYCMERGFALAVAAYLRDEELNCPEPSIRIACTRTLDDGVIGKVCLMMDEAYEKVGPQPDLCPKS